VVSGGTYAGFDEPPKKAPSIERLSFYFRAPRSGRGAVRRTFGSTQGFKQGGVERRQYAARGRAAVFIGVDEGALRAQHRGLIHARHAVTFPSRPAAARKNFPTRSPNEMLLRIAAWTLALPSYILTSV